MTAGLADDPTVIARLLDHIDHKTTDLSEGVWREPVEHYTSQERFEAEIKRVLRRTPTPFCPSAALPEVGSYVARDAALTPIVAMRGRDGMVRAFRNACRHRGVQLVDGAGCKKALTCRYHAWTYGLDGQLRGVPHEHGFPGLDKSKHGSCRSRRSRSTAWCSSRRTGRARPSRGSTSCPTTSVPNGDCSRRRRQSSTSTGRSSSRPARGLSHPLDARRHVLSPAIRQHQCRRVLRAQQPRQLSLSQHRKAARRAAGRAQGRRRADPAQPSVSERVGGDVPDPHDAWR